MKTKNFFFLGALLFAGTAFASGSSAPKTDKEPLPPLDRNINPIELNPSVIRKRLLEENIDIRISANGVQKAKEYVNLARSNTFVPSLNLGGALSSLVNPSFLWTSVSALLPFLMPSNWFDMFQEEQLLEADKKSYQILQLDTFASAYTLYETVLNDQRLQQLFQDDLEDWRRIERITAIDRSRGEASDNDVLTSKARRALAENRALNLKSLVTREISDLRQMLSYHPNKPVTLADYSVPASEFESSKIDDALYESFQRAPEREQIDFLIQASEYQKWSRRFSFIQAVSVSSVAAPGESQPGTDFKNFQVGGSLNFSWGTFNLVQLSELDIKEYKLRKTSLAQELEHTLDVGFSQLGLVVQRFNTAKESEDAFRTAFRNNQRDYDQGQIELRDLLTSRIDMEDAITARIQAQTDLNTLRVTLHRTFRTAEFSTIKGCDVPNSPSNRQKYGIPDSPDLPFCLPVNQ